MFIVLWITYGLTVFITWKTRNIKSSFNEVREMCFTCIVILASMTTNTAMQFAHPRYPLSRRFRVVSTLFDSVCVNVVWWGIMAKPIFNCLFRRQKYLREWTAKLYDDGMKLDPRNNADLVIVILLSCIYGINLCATLFALFNRKYPPLRSKGPLLMTAMYISSVFWFIGDLQVDGHVTLVGSVLTDCRGFGFWVRIILGVCTITVLISIRCYIFYRIFNQNLPGRGWRFFLPIGIYFMCLLIIGIVVSALKPSKSVQYVPGLDLCNMDKPLKVTMFVILWVTDAFTCFVTWKVRNIRSSFNEVREVFFSLFIMITALTINTGIQFAHPQYPLNRTYRIISTIFDTAAVNAIWWGIMAKPLFSCLFRRQKYLQEWTAKLYEDDLQKEYEMPRYQNRYVEDDSYPLETSKQAPNSSLHGADNQSSGSRLSFRYD
ncbi:hypothetical protein EV178_005156 [Coemansia sp. RSA 1646]|nr:hypothetical protein EV178_005156 [Coemansia sp. RSA 1646]